MSQENVENVRGALFDVFNREGLDGLLSRLDPEIEWTTTGSFLERATYRGREEVRRYIGSIVEEFEDLSAEPVELFDLGERIVVVGQLSGRGKLSGAPVELTLASVVSLRDGKIVRIRNYPSKEEALEAAGLRE